MRQLSWQSKLEQLTAAQHGLFAPAIPLKRALAAQGMLLIPSQFRPNALLSSNPSYPSSNHMMGTPHWRPPRRRAEQHNQRGAEMRGLAVTLTREAAKRSGSGAVHSHGTGEQSRADREHGRGGGAGWLVYTLESSGEEEQVESGHTWYTGGWHGIR